MYLNVHKLRFGEFKFVYLPKSGEEIIVKGVLIKYWRAGPYKAADKSGWAKTRKILEVRLNNT